MIFKFWETAIFRELIYLYRHARIALFGQVLALATSFIPIFLNQISSLPNIIFAASIATVATPVVSWAASSTLPTIEANHFARRLRQILVSLCYPILAAAAFLFLYFVTRTEITLIIFAGLFMSALQSFYSTSIAVLVRLDRPKDISTTRFVNNSMSFVLALLVGSLGMGWLGYVFSGALGFLSPLLVLAPKWAYLQSDLKLLSSQGSRVPGRDSQSGLKNRHFHVVVVSFISTLLSQIPYLITPFVGAYTQVWAVAMRISTGIETLSGGIVGPLIDTKRATAIRDGDTNSQRMFITLGYALSGLFSFFAGLALVGLVFIFAIPTSDGNDAGLVILALCVLLFCQSLAAIKGQFLMLLGSVRIRIGLDFLRMTVVIAFAFTPISQVRASILMVGLIIWIVVQDKLLRSQLR